MKKKEERKIIDEFKCDMCQRSFYRKWVRSQNNWTKINEVSYWTEGKEWGDYKLICRVCLNNWFEKAQKDFTSLVSEKKQKVFFNYRYLGLFDKSKEIFKD